MTKNSDFKHLVRSRMELTGENYTTALAALRLDREAARLEHLRRIRPFFQDGDTGAPSAHTGPPSAHAVWRDPLGGPAGRESSGGTLLRIPARRRTRLSVVLELLERFSPGRTYTETEVNALLREAHEDVAWLRREMVDYGLLARDSLGTYWLAEAVPVRAGNAAQEVSDWERIRLPELLAAGRVSQQAPAQTH
ncbi:DUF2087 domain-containing protein [Brevibacterium album]|uniref:DUF2087 domain-containing protein n=1 Tax=Brevibacterium album TaxID=417948 RepID=UPI0004042CE4|nr:DUF2087 domain-containing protein [Brevibacterium album]